MVLLPRRRLNSVQERALCCLWVVLPGAPTALLAVWIETSGGYDSTVQSCGRCVALVGQQQPRARARACFAVSYTLALHGLGEPRRTQRQ